MPQLCWQNWKPMSSSWKPWIWVRSLPRASPSKPPTSFPRWTGWPAQMLSCCWITSRHPNFQQPWRMPSPKSWTPWWWMPRVTLLQGQQIFDWGRLVPVGVHQFMGRSHCVGQKAEGHWGQEHQRNHQEGSCCHFAVHPTAPRMQEVAMWS